MARLIVEDGGRTRRFRLNEGKLVLGSGEDCQLRLEAADVARRHAVLELEHGRAVLRPEPGVLPPRSAGRELHEATVLKHGQAVTIGAARLWIEDEDAPPVSPSEPVPAVRGRVAGATLADRLSADRKRGGGRRAARRGGSAAAQGRETQPRRPRGSRAGPPWLVLSLVAVLVAAVLIWLRASSSGSAGEAFSASGSLARMRAMRKDANYPGMLRELEKVDRHADEVSAEYRAEFDKLRAELDAHGAKNRLAGQNRFGSMYLETQIRSFEQKRVRANMEPAWIRVLLKRCHHFLETWPQHEEVNAVRRMLERYSAVVDLDDPPSLADVEVEVETLTWARPKLFGEALEVLHDFMPTASAEERQACERLLAEVESAQQQHFDELMAESVQDRKDGRLAEAVAALVGIVCQFGDDKLVAAAAEALVDMPDIGAFLEAYERDQPHTFEALVRNSIVRAKARALGILE